MNEMERQENTTDMMTRSDYTFLLKKIEANAKKIEAVELKASKHGKQLRDIEEEYPLLPPEADDLAKAVQRKGVEVMGGKKSNAYTNIDLRRKVYRDIYTEIKRNFDLIDVMGRQKSYKKLKRKNLKGALMLVDEYILPIGLENEINNENDLGDDE